MALVDDRLIIAQSCFNLTVETHGIASTPSLPRRNVTTETTICSAKPVTKPI